MNSLAVPTLGNLAASGRIAPTQRVFKSRIVVNSNSRRFDGAIPAVVSNYSRDDAIGVRLKREGKLRNDKSMDANNEAAIAAAIATGIAVAIVAVEPAHAALASHLMPPTVYAPQFADLAVNIPAAVTTTQAGVDGTLDTTLISTSVFLLLATVLGSAGKKYADKRARRAVWRGLASPHEFGRFDIRIRRAPPLQHRHQSGQEDRRQHQIPRRHQDRRPRRQIPQVLPLQHHAAEEGQRGLRSKSVGNQKDSKSAKDLISALPTSSTTSRNPRVRRPPNGPSHPPPPRAPSSSPNPSPVTTDTRTPAL